jgi:hypothetical protein
MGHWPTDISDRDRLGWLQAYYTELEKKLAVRDEHFAKWLDGWATELDDMIGRTQYADALHDAADSIRKGKHLDGKPPTGPSRGSPPIGPAREGE